MSGIAHPHDLLFKALLSTPETAGTLLRERLPPEVVQLLAPEPPRLVEGSFVEEHLQPYYSDRASCKIPGVGGTHPPRMSHMGLPGRT
ncbi:MAG: Rpn family recombination-promoting nuclease/putative transposase, partial [Magnetococcales bacterium]|nr:Rpn family recombination-promoting nuclease/putative transposase [Magnetococcales bacterium]